MKIYQYFFEHENLSDKRFQQISPQCNDYFIDFYGAFTDMIVKTLIQRRLKDNHHIPPKLNFIVEINMTGKIIRKLFS